MYLSVSENRMTQTESEAKISSFAEIHEATRHHTVLPVCILKNERDKLHILMVEMTHLSLPGYLRIFRSCF